MLVSCAPIQRISEISRINSETSAIIDNKILRIIDKQAGVVCWVFSYQGGISCLPLSDTRLDE